MTKNKVHRALRRRLLPLFVAIFCQGFVLFYATEKLFMTSIGFNAATIGVMVALYSIVIILTETPFGILADRWSRKYVLMLAGVALALSGLISGLSTNIPMFLVGTSLWGVYFALYSGTYDSVIYDTLLEETNSKSKFEQYLGKMKFLDGSALVLGSLLGGLIAQHIGIRETYFFTVPIALASVFALYLFREPQLHKLEVAVPIRQHIQMTLHAVLRQRYLVPVLMVLITTTVSSYLILEFSQLWLIALAVPIFLFGPIDAAIGGGYGLGGFFAGHLKLKKPVMIGLLVAILISTIALSVTQNLVVIVVCLAFAIAGLTGINVVFTKLLHDSFSSNIRVGAASAVSTISRIVVVPTSIGFGYVAQKADIFSAAWILVGFVVITLLFALKAIQTTK